MRVPIVPSACQHCVVSGLDFGHCTGCAVILHYDLNPLMAYAVEHIFMFIICSLVRFCLCVLVHQAVCGILVP